MAEAARQQAEEQRVAEQRRAAMLATKADRERQVAEARVGRRVAEKLRKQMEQQELRDIQAAQERTSVSYSGVPHEWKRLEVSLLAVSTILVLLVHSEHCMSAGG